MDQKGIHLNDIKGSDNGTVQSAYVRDEEYLGSGNVGLVAAKYQGTAADQRDMSVLGRDQLLRVCKKKAFVQELISPLMLQSTA